MRREGIGCYALGTALTGRSAADIDEEVKSESREVYELLGKLASKVGLAVAEVRPHVDKSSSCFRGSRTMFLKHLLATTPTNLKYTLNLKDYQYNPPRENEEESR